jgi:hypothetical protein
MHFLIPKLVSRNREFRDFLKVLAIIVSKTEPRIRYFQWSQKPEREGDGTCFHGKFERSGKMAEKLMCLLYTIKFTIRCLVSEKNVTIKTKIRNQRCTSYARSYHRNLRAYSRQKYETYPNQTYYIKFVNLFDCTYTFADFLRKCSCGVSKRYWKSWLTVSVFFRANYPFKITKALCLFDIFSFNIFSFLFFPFSFVKKLVYYILIRILLLNCILVLVFSFILKFPSYYKEVFFTF